MVEKVRQRAPGAGVKASDGVTEVKRRNVMIDPLSLKVLEKIGGDNLSLGVREAARRLKESGDTAKFSKKRHEQRQARSKLTGLNPGSSSPQINARGVGD